MRVVVGVGGGIAAYKVPGLVRLFAESGDDVTVVPTPAALNFVGEPTWAALSGNPVSTHVWDRVAEVNHVRIGQQADLVVVAPATADLLARAAAGMADDLLTATLLTARCPVVFAPAMHTEMWQHPATQANVAVLRARGALVLDPAVGRLTGADSGPGRMPEPEVIHRASLARLAPQDLAGLTVLVTAGGTREPLDPVRFLGNRSSGRQGHALAEVALRRGAAVVLVTTAALPDPHGAAVVRVESAEQMRAAVIEAAPGADMIAMAAAVADFRPATSSGVKLKKGSSGEPVSIPLERNPDILAELVRARTADPTRSRQVIVGFAAETGDDTADPLQHGRRKLTAKGCDLLVVNDVSAGKVFDRPDNEAVILGRDGGEEHLPLRDKVEIADAVWNAAARLLD